MTAVLEAPVEASPEPPVRQGRGLLAPALALAAVALLALAALDVTREAGRLAPLTPSFAGTAPVVTLPSYGPRGTHVVGYEHAATARLSLPLTNRGRLPMTVRELDLGGGLAPLLEVEAVRGLPVTLGPGETATVEVAARLANCRFFHEREVQYYEGARFSVSVLGVDSSRWAAFDRPIMVHSPMIVGCPDRKLDRQRDNRVDLTRAG